MAVNQEWLVRAPSGVRLALDCIAAFAPTPDGVVVYLKGGHVLDLAMTAQDFEDLLAGAGSAW